MAPHFGLEVRRVHTAQPRAVRGRARKGLELGAVHPVADQGEVVEGIALRMDPPGLEEWANAFGGVDPVADVEDAASARMGLAQLVGQRGCPAVGHDVDAANRSKASGQKGRNGGADIG